MTEQENKALFFAQYLGQKVLIWKGYSSTYPCELNGTRVAASTSETQISFLQLRSCSQLTDEECKEIGRCVGLANCIIERNEECIFITDDSYYIGIYYDGTIVMYKGKGLNVKPYWNHIQQLIAIIRGFGVLLPFTTPNIAPDGTVTTYSENELIAMGWARIETTKK